jgi:hypothetical protein
MIIGSFLAAEIQLCFEGFVKKGQKLSRRHCSRPCEERKAGAPSA